jgi:uncharacterized protein YegJ (DUF2314 family)
MINKIFNLIFGRKVHTNNNKFAIDENNEMMKLAITEARGKLPYLIEAIERDDKLDVCIKLRHDYNGASYFYWVSDIKLINGTFSGKINSQDVNFPEIKMGNEVNISEGEIMDWMYQKNDKYYGNFTLKMMLKISPNKENLKLLEKFGDIQ